MSSDGEARREQMESVEKAANFLPRVDDSALNPSQVDGRVVTLTAPASTAAEQYRTLYYRLERLRSLRPMKVIAITSAVAGEGKTLTAVNLALTAARADIDRRILLIDGDLRRSHIADTLGVRSRPGLFELLSGDAETKDAVRRFKSTALAVLPSGGAAEEPTQILASNRMKRLLELVRDAFDEVYIDVPPALPFADASILACQSDGVLMVIRANATPVREVNQAIEQLAGAPMIGCVLNGAELSAVPYLNNFMRG
jgi:capsular exopolysaccharide synthesis family protein